MAQKDIFSENNNGQNKSALIFSPNLPRRHRLAKMWLFIFQMSTVIGIIALSALLFNIINDSNGLTALKFKIDPKTLTEGRPLEELSFDELNIILEQKVSKNRYRTIFQDKPLEQHTKKDLIDLVTVEVLKPTVIDNWPLLESIFHRNEIEKEVAVQYPEAYLEFRNWISRDLIVSPQNSNPLVAGIRTAILGSLLIIAVTMFFAIPIGVGAAIYLEEYANQDRWFNRAIQTNINNLAAVPSIIYGMLGLTVFVRWLGKITGGSIFGFGDPNVVNGRTILSGGLTLAILVLPLIIINSQEAIRAVPNSLRHAGYGVGATKWQTIRSHVLPNAMPGILTGTILAVSRAFGETAPLIVIGASTFITTDPSSIFSQFTTLPAQIYQWTARPQAEWRNLAAAAIIVLMVILIALNAVAILLRNRFSRKY